MLSHSQIVFLETELRSTQDFFGISLHFQIPRGLPNLKHKAAT